MKNPTHKLADDDSGAETVRNFRYQFLYGVVLLSGAHAKKFDYRAVWCEQEDDLLAEISDDLFDSYQVKSRKPETGPWSVREEGFHKSISLFVRLETQYASTMRSYCFVSNAEVLRSTDAKKLHQCPEVLTENARNSSDHEAMSETGKKGVALLARRTECTPEEIHGVLKKLRFAKAPDRESGFGELVNAHLPQIEGVEELPLRRVRQLARDLIAAIEDASSLASQDPARHYGFLDRKQRCDPQLKAKRIDVGDFGCLVKKMMVSGFRYTPKLTGTNFAQRDRKFRRFLAKLRRGGLEHYADTLRNQATDTEAILLDLATRPQGQEDVDHLRQAVKAECDMAHLRNLKVGEAFGIPMLRELDLKFAQLAEVQSANVCRQPKEVLMGTAGMLTDDCEVWWSERFDVEKEI